MFKLIDHVEIVTDQPERTIEFYTAVLGFKVKSRDQVQPPGSARRSASSTWSWAARPSS
jgi:catechol 2,3-dioxygenase-like lactoylglutathione lyase family enzyme